jgi:hypothetical protein
MKRFHAALTLGVAVVLVGITALAHTVTRDQGGRPILLDPPWVSQDGTIDETKVPDLLPVATSNGRLVGYVRGADVFSPKTDDLFVYSAGRVVGEVTDAGFRELPGGMKSGGIE